LLTYTKNQCDYVTLVFFYFWKLLAVVQTG